MSLCKIGLHRSFLNIWLNMPIPYWHILRFSAAYIELTPLPRNQKRKGTVIMQQREYFLGGNTASGFFSYYDYLMRQEDAAKIYCIKGGPGTGKSSLMKAIAAEAQKKGLDIDLIHCSSDPTSLDGLIIPKLNTAFVDGTSPHIVDPKTPGAVDTIIHLGDCWQEDDIAPLKHDIIRYNRQISSYFASAYRYLAAAAQLYLDTAIWSAPHVKPVVVKALKQLKETYIAPLENYGPQEGFLRKLFLTAITPSGIICHVPSFSGAATCVLEGPGFVTGEILHMLCTEYLALGYNVEAFYSPLNPSEQIEHLYIPALNQLFATHDIINQFSISQNAVTIPLELSLPEDSAVIVNQNKMLMLTLLEQGVQTIQKAKTVHDLLETCYVPHMDFSKVEKIKEHILQSLVLD